MLTYLHLLLGRQLRAFDWWILMRADSCRCWLFMVCVWSCFFAKTRDIIVGWPLVVQKRTLNIGRESLYFWAAKRWAKNTSFCLFRGSQGLVLSSFHVNLSAKYRHFSISRTKCHLFLRYQASILRDRVNSWQFKALKSWLPLWWCWIFRHLTLVLIICCLS